MTGKSNSEMPRSVTDIDWTCWQPLERAVLCFIRNGDQLLLIHKKTGLGTGKVNAPGGRIENGESPEEAAIRETQEEVGLVPSQLRQCGELSFIFTNGYSLHGTIFFASQFTGTPIETREALPFWCAVSELPYDKMWADDRYWLPHVLDGKYIRGFFIFDEEVMLSHRVDIE